MKRRKKEKEDKTNTNAEEELLIKGKLFSIISLRKDHIFELFPIVLYVLH